MRVPRYNYVAQFPEISTLMEDLRRMLLTGHYILGDEVRSFETEFADYLGTKYVRGVNCGTDALLLALRVLGIGAGDEVITHANTFHATVAAIKLAGATPILIDADESSFLIDESQIPAAITSRTRALIPVHLYGKPTPLKQIVKLADAYGLALLEDAAQAHGAALAGKKTGTTGLMGCFSFHPSKNLAAAGDAGAVATNDQRLAEEIERHRALGQRGQNNHVVLGYNTKLDSVQAAILRCKLSKLDEWNERRRQIAGLYRETLRDLPVTFQSTTPDELHVYHLFAVRTKCRDLLLAHLQQAGIDAVVRYPTPIHLQPAFRESKWRCGQFPVAEKLAKELLCLPIRPDMHVDEATYVADCMRSFFDGRKT